MEMGFYGKIIENQSWKVRRNAISILVLQLNEKKFSSSSGLIDSAIINSVDYSVITNSIFVRRQIEKIHVRCGILRLFRRVPFRFPIIPSVF